MDDDFVNGNRRRAVLEISEDDDGHFVGQDVSESRNVQAKGAYYRQQSPNNDQVIDHYDSPPPKRLRMDDRKRKHNGERTRTRNHHSSWDPSCDRDHHVRFISPGRGGKSIDDYTPTSALLASVNRCKADSGRLSYWDGGDQTTPGPIDNSPLEYRGPAFTSSPLRAKKHRLAKEFWSEDIRLEEMRQLFPYADQDWMDEMAGFDVDKFFEEIDGPILSTSFLGQVAVSGLDTITEHPDERGYRSRIVEVSTPMESAEDCGNAEDEDSYSPHAGDVVANVVEMTGDKSARIESKVAH